jgi:hypothetical protein
MDIGKRNELIEKIKMIGLPDDMEETPVVSLEDFFAGNDDLGSIGCNLINHPGIDCFFNLLAKIRSRPDVEDVLVGIYEVEEEDTTMWPFSEQVFIISNASENDISDWVKYLEVDDISVESPTIIKPSPDLPNNYKLFQLWWD